MEAGAESAWLCYQEGKGKQVIGFGFQEEVVPHGRLLLLSCSAKKSVARKPIPARLRYKGTLFRLGIRFAERYGFTVLILSAKYGFIRPDQLISHYDQKLTGPYYGPWPGGRGYYLGSQLYFGNAPDRFKPLLPPLSMGRQRQAMKQLLVSFTEEVT